MRLWKQIQLDPMVLLVLFSFLVVGVVVASFCKSYKSVGVTGFGLGFLMSVVDLNLGAKSSEHFWTVPMVMGQWALMAYGFSLDSKTS